MIAVPQDVVDRLVAMALAEDVGSGDATSLATIPPESQTRAHMVARHPLTVCGLAVACRVFQQLDPAIQVEQRQWDGDRVDTGAILLAISGPTRSVLTAERTALNFVQRLSGIATLTARFVEAVRPLPTRILDTRKTTPGWRLLEKYAVKMGGGTNHRIGLFDQILIKDNHLEALAHANPNAIAAAVRQAREHYPTLRVEVEADTLEQVLDAVDAGADVILLDNMPLDQLRAAVSLVRGRAQTEASGGVRLETVRSIAETGVDAISVGALTHSASSCDIALDFLPTPAP